MPQESPVARFFAAYERNIADGNFEALAAQFAPAYLAGGAGGLQCLLSAEMAAGLGRRRELLTSLGCGPSRLVSFTETPLDGRFALARTLWSFAVDAADKPLSVESTYLLDTAEPMHILVYIAHQDLVAMLKSRR